MASILCALQQEVADRLSDDAFFASIPVLVEQPLEVTYELQASAAEAGIWVVVLVPEASVTSFNAPGPIFDPVEIAVQVRENVPVASGPHALEVAEYTLALLHLYRPETVNEVMTAAPRALRRLDEPDVVAYEVRVRTQVVVGVAT